MPKQKPEPVLPTNPAAANPIGDRFWIDGREIKLAKHPKDFVVLGSSPALQDFRQASAADAALGTPEILNPNLSRFTTAGGDNLESAMIAARQDAVSLHVYNNTASPDEELIFNGDLLVAFKSTDEASIDELAEKYKLVHRGTMGHSHVFAVTQATGVNCIKAANQIRQEESVADASPLPLQNIRKFGFTAALFPRQWHLDSSLRVSPDLAPDAGIDAPLAWQITNGSPNIVVAVMDDGFDLSHPAFQGVNLSPAARDFAASDNRPAAENGDYHGTPVAALIFGQGDIRGVAPGCQFLPVRIPFGTTAAAFDIVQAFRYVSLRADVVNCSFGTPPSSSPFHQAFRDEIAQLVRSGGRQGRGLVMVFAAGNDDSPTYLPASQNINGIQFLGANDQIATIPPGIEVHSGYPEIPGVIAVAAMSSRKRKSGFSNWGPNITVAAPSNNSHQLRRFAAFAANYRGLGLVSATNRLGFGEPFAPRPDDLSTLDVREDFYTEQFGGTSGAAPIVAGVCALILSANPSLSAAQVRQILTSSATNNVDPTLDLVNDRNVQNKSGQFVNNRSLWFGAGKVNAYRAVRRAQALAGPMSPTPNLTEATPVLADRSVSNRSRRRSAISPGGRIEIAQAIANVSQFVTVTLNPLSITPPNLFDLEFQDDLVGIDDEWLMRSFKLHLAAQLPSVAATVRLIPDNPALTIEDVASTIALALSQA